MAPCNFYNLRARMYEPRVGRFANEDPAIQNVAYPQSSNRYVYVMNNSTNYVDPLGLFCVPWFPTPWEYSYHSREWVLKSTSPNPYVIVGSLRILCYWDKVETGKKTRIRRRLCCECWRCWIENLDPEERKYRRVVDKTITYGFWYPYGPGHQYIPICDKPQWWE